MMFIQYFALGATMPVMSLYLKDHLGFNGMQMGLVMAMPAIAAFISPLVGACIADRIIRAERLLGISHLIGFGLMSLLATQSTFTSVLLLYLGYSMVVFPSVALTTAVTFHHIPKGSEDFGRIRVWGTIGWIAAAWFFTLVWVKGGDGVGGGLTSALRLGAAASLVQGIYAFTLPDSGAKGRKIETILPVESFRVFANRRVVVLCMVCFAMLMIDKFYFLGMSPFLAQNGFEKTNIMPIMSIGQIPEIFTMMLLGACLLRFGFKKMLIAGVILNIWRFGAFMLAGDGPIMYSGICCHGAAYTFVAVTTSIYLDKQSDKHSRAGVHMIFALIISGFAGLIGNISAGLATDIFTKADGEINFIGFWAVPAIVAAICLTMVVWLFTEPADQTIKTMS